MMTKKDYELLAECIRKSDDLDELKLVLVNELRRTNPRFNPVTFARACRKED